MKVNWQTKKLIELCDMFSDGDWIESKDQSPEGVRLIQTGNVGNGVFKDRAEKARYISEATYKRLRCTEIFEGDCLVSRLPDPVGRACILPDTGEKMITAVDCTIIRFDKKKVIPEFFNYYSQSDQYLNGVDHETSGTTRKRISRSKLAEIEIPVPPLPEQQRIVSVLNEAFASIAQAKFNAERNRVNAQELYESILEEVFTNSGQDWEDKKLESVSSKITVGHVGSMASKYKHSGIPFLRSQNIRPNSIDLDNVVYIDEEFNTQLKKSQLSPGDVAIVRTGYPGTSAVIPESLPISNCSDLVILKPGSLVNPYYLCLFFNSTYGKKLVLGNIVGAAQKHFNVTAAKNISIPVPSLAEQRAIVERLESLSAETGRLQEIYQSKINNIDELKKSILAKAFRGEL